MLSLPSTRYPEDDEEDNPIAGPLVEELEGPTRLPVLIAGAGTFSNQYNTDDLLGSQIPVRTVRLALRYGIRAFDTSIYYGPSELVLGNALQLLKEEFPRSSYQLMTKCGRFGTTNFDYSPSAIRDSVRRSLERLQTSYLDTVYLHDVEFVATPFLAKTSGNHSSALAEDKATYGLLEGEEAVIRGEGDQKVLDAFAELQRMKEEGLVKRIGITGYPVPTLLRLAILILYTPPLQPVDVVLSYSHLSLQNDTLLQFLPSFRERAKVAQVVAASPFSMGLITPSGPPPWHPAPKELRVAKDTVKEQVRDLPRLALNYSIRKSLAAGIPLVVGFGQPKEVHESVGALRGVLSGDGAEDLAREAGIATQIFRDRGYLSWSWSSP